MLYRSLWVFHSNVRCWSFTGVWVNANILNVSSTILNILADLNNAVVWMVSFQSLIFKASTPSTSIWGLFWLRQLQFVSPSSSCSITFCSPARSYCLSLFLFFFFYFPPKVRLEEKVYYSVGSLFCWISQGLVVWPELGDWFESQNPKEVSMSCFLRRI